MTDCEKVIDSLNNFFGSEDYGKIEKKNPHFAKQLKNIKPEDITFGEAPKLIIGYVYGNATCSGESTYGDTTTRRTISMDFSTNNMLFIASNNTASIDVVQEAVIHFDYNTDKYHFLSEEESLAEEEGKEVTTRALWDVNFVPDKSSYRLNRYGFTKTSEVNSPVYPIYSNLVMENGKEKKWTIGYWINYSDGVKFDFDMKVPMSGKSKKTMWILIGVGVAALLLFILISSLS